MTQGKVALVTGVSPGIGRTTAASLADQGFRVFGTIRQSVDAEAALGSVTLVRLDVRDDESARTCVRAVLDQAGRLDALVNSAGYVLLGCSENFGGVPHPASSVGHPLPEGEGKQIREELALSPWGEGVPTCRDR